MTLEEIEQHIVAARESGFVDLEHRTATARLKIFVTTPHTEVTAALAVLPTPKHKRTIRTSSFGRFARWAEGPVAGSRVTAGDIIGFLQIGLMRTAIEASEDGVLGKFLVEPGDLVGYGQAVAEFA